MTLSAPFHYFGGKSRIAHEVWAGLGNVEHYIEPFFGSGATLLARPHKAKVETVNDRDGLLANVWRALQADPDAVAQHADWPVNEVDLHARHSWLLGEKPRVERLMADPDAYDAKAAGWWIWGASAWIGSGWCSGEGPWVVVDGELVDGRMSGAQGVNRKLPHMSGGRGVNRQLPHMSGGRGVNRQLPELNHSRGVVSARNGLHEWFADLSERLRGVKVACGDWSRVCGPSVRAAGNGVCGIFLDPPYSHDLRETVYAHDEDVAADVLRWCIAHEGEKNLRLVLAGYSEHDELGSRGWRKLGWKAAGGYGAQGKGRGLENATKETLWFSPQCLQPAQMDMFA